MHPPDQVSPFLVDRTFVSWHMAHHTALPTVLCVTDKIVVTRRSCHEIYGWLWTDRAMVNAAVAWPFAVVRKSKAAICVR